MNKPPPPTLLENRKIKMNRNIEVLGVFRIHLLLSHFITSELYAICFYRSCQDFIGMGLSPPTHFFI